MSFITSSKLGRTVTAAVMALGLVLPGTAVAAHHKKEPKAKVTRFLCARPGDHWHC